MLDRVAVEVARHRKTFGNDDTASRVASAIVQANASADAGFEDIRRFHAPSECGEFVVRQRREDLTAVCHKFDLTPRQINELLESRVDGKFLYFNRLGLDPDDVTGFDIAENWPWEDCYAV